VTTRFEDLLGDTSSGELIESDYKQIKLNDATYVNFDSTYTVYKLDIGETMNFYVKPTESN
jgi:hypothetical protein